MSFVLDSKRCVEETAKLLPRLSDYVDHWAKLDGARTALIESRTGEEVSWKKFRQSVDGFAAILDSLGLQKGDVIATTLPLIKEHVYLMFACFRLGILIAPLDLRLKENEVSRALTRIRPKAYFHLGLTPVVDFRPMVAALKAKHGAEIPHWLELGKDAAWLKGAALKYLKARFTGRLRRFAKRVDKRDPALIIFTTGSTGEPKPALLSHESILMQCVSLQVAFGAGRNDRMLCNLPPSHVGCTTEALAASIFTGGVSILVPVFTVDDTLNSIAKYRATIIGQVPAQYNMEWRSPLYAQTDLTSLRVAIYGGQGVSDEFLRQLGKMAPRIGSGLGMTETAGFCTYIIFDAEKASTKDGLGAASPLCPLTIRQPMKENGNAGDEMPNGEVGEICFSGPQVFSGYLGDESATRKAVSRDGVLHTGDMGRIEGGVLKLAGRRKQIMKPKGYQVFPGDVETHIAKQLGDRAALVAVVGVEHHVFSEGIMAFVEKRDGATLTIADVMSAAGGLAAYARPSHVEIISAGSLPLNRVAKVDYLLLKDRADAVAREMRAHGKWDAEA